MKKNGYYKEEKLDSTLSLTEIHSLYCDRCNNFNNFRVLNSYDFIEQYYLDDIAQGELLARYQLIQCMGCDEIRFRIAFHYPNGA